MAASLGPALASSSISKRHSSLSISLISVPQSSNSHFSKWNPQLGICKISTWNGLRHLGVPTSRYIVKIERKGRCKGKGVYASLFGVGAPEALVIGVVALLVFGPKGLAEVARNIGKTLRTFQPTIRELQDVSREFKSTLEREIGLDETQDPIRSTPRTPPTTVPENSQVATDPTVGSPAESKAYSTEEYLKAFTEQQKKQKEMESSDSQVQPQGLAQDNSPSSTEESFTEGNATTNEEQLEASAEQKETASPETPVEPQSQSQVTDEYPTSKDAETQEYLKKLEEEVQAILAEKQKKIAPAATEVKPQVSDNQEAASVTSTPQKPESEP